MRRVAQKLRRAAPNCARAFSFTTALASLSSAILCFASVARGRAHTSLAIARILASSAATSSFSRFAASRRSANSRSNCATWIRACCSDRARSASCLCSSASPSRMLAACASSRVASRPNACRKSCTASGASPSKPAGGEPPGPGGGGVVGEYDPGGGGAAGDHGAVSIGTGCGAAAEPPGVVGGVAPAGGAAGVATSTVARYDIGSSPVSSVSSRFATHHPSPACSSPAMSSTRTFAATVSSPRASAEKG